MSRTPSRVMSQVVQAGAGAGKTYTLVHEVIAFYRAFLKENGRTPRVVLTTFTIKATEELKERLALEALAQRDSELLKYVTGSGGLFISTIHGVASKFLNRYSQSLELDSSLTMIDPAQDFYLFKKACRNFLGDPANGAILENISVADLVQCTQKYAILLDLNPAVQITTYDIQRTHALKFLEQMARDLTLCIDEIKAVHSEPKWQEYTLNLQSMRDELASLCQETSVPIEQDTARFQACGRLAERFKSIRKPSEKKGESPFSDEFENFFKKVRVEFEDIVAPPLDPHVWLRVAAWNRLFDAFARSVITAVQIEKRENGMMSLAELEALTLRSVRNYPSVAKEFSEDWDFWFIDEYQDTSPVQVEMLLHLVGETPTFIVGDPQQSIYYFRGARSSVFFDKRLEVSEKGGAVRRLTINRRSRRPLLHFLNDFYAHVSSDFMAMDPLPEDAIDAGAVVAQIFNLGTEDEEPVAVAAHIDELRSRDVALSDIVVLGRTKRDLAKVEEACFRKQIPVHVHAAGRFFETPEVVDALVLLKFLAFPDDDLNFAHLSRSPILELSSQFLFECHKNREGRASYWQSLKNNSSYIEAGDQEILNILRTALATADQKSIAGIWRELLFRFSFSQKLLVQDTSGLRESNLWKLIDLLHAEEIKPAFSYAEFLWKMDKEIKSKIATGGEAVAPYADNRVQLMTIHASKGLQFDHVILPFVNRRQQESKRALYLYDEGLNLVGIGLRDSGGEMIYPIWSGQAVAQIRKMEGEEVKRLLYVALTRAKRSVALAMSSKPERGSFGSMIKVPLSEGMYDHAEYKILVKNSVIDVPEPFGLHDSTEDAAPINIATEHGRWRELVSFSPEARPAPQRFVQPSELSLASQFGLRFHRLLEIAAHGKKDFLKNRTDLDEKTRDAIDYIFEITSPPMAQILAAGHAEWGFLYLENGAMVQGRIDIWAQIGETIWIVDYKSGSSRYVQKALAQLTEYEQALRRRGIAGKYKKVALYPFEKKCVIAE